MSLASFIASIQISEQWAARSSRSLAFWFWMISGVIHLGDQRQLTRIASGFLVSSNKKPAFKRSSFARGKFKQLAGIAPLMNPKFQSDSIQ
jgi:hypothetical protein